MTTTRRLARLAMALLLLAPALHAQSPNQLDQSAAFVASLQNPDGGFGSTPGGASSLSSTSSGIRTLGYLGGSIPDVLAAIRYVESCVDKSTGAFAPTPGGSPDVRTTAIGLMAVSALKLDAKPYTEAALKYFHENASSFEDIRIAIAGLEAVNTPSPDFPAWTQLVNKDRNPDGTWGEHASTAFATGGSAAALLRMGVDLDHADAVKSAIIDNQNEDGGWSDGASPSTLSSSYRVVRCLYMLDARPDLSTLRQFIARHRQPGGGYAPAPGQPADLSNTYYAAIMQRWARQLEGLSPYLETAGFNRLTTGQGLEGWQGDQSLWKANGHTVIGTSPGINHNDFLATTDSFDDFALKLTFRINGDDSANSGVMLRAKPAPPHEMSGYQADIGQNYWGCLYDESRRNKVLVPATERAIQSINHSGWNHYDIRAMGPNIRLTLNGITSVQYTEPDPAIPTTGQLALQIHSGKPLTVRFRDIYLQRLPRPTADAEAKTGFLLRTVETPQGTRKFTVYVPKDYDALKPLPVVLFLHGSGERGEDGITPSQVGLGPAILQNPSRFPCIAVFPQARETWAADSDDIKAALAALHQVGNDYEIDTDRVILTGLSMGGRGSWELAAAYPSHFSAVVPICGPGSLDKVDALKSLPIRVYNGDEDRLTTVQNLRQIVEALQKAGGNARLTEYRGVGHNSWDRAYSDPNLASWMLSQRRNSQ